MTVSNAYVTAAEADKLVRLLLRPYDEFRVFWEVLDDEEKDVYLLRSTEQIDALTFVGRKTVHNQENQFPRDGAKTVPQAVMKAVVYNALGFMNSQLKAESAKQIQLLKSLGVVKNLRLDATSVKTVATAESIEQAEPKIPLESKIAYNLLKPYRYGGFSLR
jgi:hypothetical protein